MSNPSSSYGSDQQSSAPLSQGADYWLQNYRLGKTLGIGSFGKVKVAEHVLTGHQVAIKILNRRKIRQMEMEEKVLREIKILRLFLHPHIIRLYEIIDSPTDIFVVMEYVTEDLRRKRGRWGCTATDTNAGELFDYIVEKGRLREDEARKFFQQIISGVEYCHRNMVVHRDLKPENLLLDSHSNVKIADFGLSNVMRDGHFLKTSCGSPNYAAPEVISGRLYAGPEVDVWSCGVILYALLCGSLPFDDENIPNLFKKIKGGIYNLPSHLSPGARDLIPRMLLVDPLKRITIPEIRQHPWFRLHLPRYLAVMQADTVATNTHVDDDVVDEVVQLGFPRDTVTESVKTRTQNKATIAYYLVVDFKRKNNSNAYLREELAEANDVMLQHPSGMMGQAGTTSLQNQRMVVEKRWRLGLTCRGPPPHLFHEVLRVLQRLQIGWKKMGPYCLKCRAVLGHRTNCSPNRCRLMPARVPSRAGSAGSEDMEPGTPQRTSQAKDSMGDLQLSEAPTGPVQQQQQILKFAIQIYKLRDGEYCLDFQRLTGDLFLFMDLCGVLLSNLRP